MRAILGGCHPGGILLCPETREEVARLDRYRDRVTLPNPEVRQYARRSLAVPLGVPEVLSFWTEGTAGGLDLPRAALLAEEVAGYKLSALPKVPPLPGARPEAGASLEGAWAARAPEQELAVSQVVAGLGSYPWGGILVAPGGVGKTGMAIEVARRLRTPTLVLVHRKLLLDQWAREIRKFVPDARVGLIQGTAQSKKVRSEELHFVVAMVHTILSASAKGALPEAFFREFGLLVVDEVHRFGAVHWEQASRMFCARWRLGLTATPDRKDGLAQVFQWSVGPVLHRYGASEGIAASQEAPTVILFELPFEVPRYAYEIPWDRDKADVTKLCRYLASHAERTARIVRRVCDAVEVGRRVLVLTCSVENTVGIAAGLCAKGVDAKAMLQSLKPFARQEVLVSQVVTATYEMMGDAVNDPSRDTLVLATPKADVRQACYRVMREFPGKKPPVVLDCFDVLVPECKGMLAARKVFYRSINSRIIGG